MGITRQQALECFASDDLIGIGMEADAVRRRLHPEGVVSYAVDRSVDFSRDFESLCEQIDGAVEMDGTGVLLHEGVHRDRSIAWLEALFNGVKQRFPRVQLQCFGAGEILALAKRSEVNLHDTIMRLRDAGLDSIRGTDAEILDDDVRQSTEQLTCSTKDWISVHRMTHELGVASTAMMTIGIGETIQQRVEHLQMLRTLQEETGGFTAFNPLSFHANGTAHADRGLDEPTSVEYLKTLAISRMILDNIDNVQSSWTTQGLKVLGMGLRFGCNDAGSVIPEDNGSKLVGKSGATEEELRRLIRDAGFMPVQRDTLYRTMFLN